MIKFIKNILNKLNDIEDLNVKFKQIQKNVNKFGKIIEELEKDIAVLKSIVNKSDSIRDKLKKFKLK